MQKTATTPSKILDLTAAAFLLVAFLTGIAGALQTPTLSIFLADELKARPIMVGFFFTGSAIMGILVSQFLARNSDKQGDRKLLILLCCLFGVLACTLFAWNSNYFILLSTGVLLSSFASTANPQMLPSPVNTPTEQAVRRLCSVHFYVLRSRLPGLSGHRSLMNWQWDLVLK